MPQNHPIRVNLPAEEVRAAGGKGSEYSKLKPSRRSEREGYGDDESKKPVYDEISKRKQDQLRAKQQAIIQEVLTKLTDSTSYAVMEAAQKMCKEHKDEAIHLLIQNPQLMAALVVLYERFNKRGRRDDD